MSTIPDDIPTVAEAEERVKALMNEEAELRKRRKALELAISDVDKRLRALGRSFNSAGEIETARMLVEVARNAETWDTLPVVQIRSRWADEGVAEGRLAKVTPKQVYIYTTRGSLEVKRFDRTTGKDIPGNEIVNLDEVLAAATRG